MWSDAVGYIVLLGKWGWWPRFGLPGNLFAQMQEDRDKTVKYASKYFIAPFLSAGTIQVTH